MPSFQDHPLAELTVRSGKLMRQSPHGHEAEYLVTQPVQIATKKDFFETGSTDVVYRFELNERPDGTWLEIFAKVLAPLNALIDRSELQFACIPANLEGRYNRVKEAIAQTNRLYAEHKALLINKVAELDVERQQEAQVQATRSATVKDQFTKLDL